jgi:hypothetical protein
MMEGRASSPVKSNAKRGSQKVTATLALKGLGFSRATRELKNAALAAEGIDLAKNLAPREEACDPCCWQFP